jgi:hypothetical protein
MSGGKGTKAALRIVEAYHAELQRLVHVESVLRGGPPQQGYTCPDARCRTQLRYVRPHRLDEDRGETRWSSPYFGRTRLSEHADSCSKLLPNALSQWMRDPACEY